MCWRSGLALILWIGAAQAEGLTFLRAVPMMSDLNGFGGLSAIEMQDGNSAVVLSDRGQAFTLSFDRSSGAIDAAPATQPRPNRDSEGLALAAGQMFYSYEGPAEIVAADGTQLPAHPDFAGFHINGAFEALAGAPDGTLYVIPERTQDGDAPFPLFRFRDGTWQVIGHLARNGPFLPVGADIGPDGQLYILWRAFSALGFRSRITRIDPDNLTAPQELLLATGLGEHDNLEGLAVWQSDSGATCLTMVSDDNFLNILRTEVVEYALTQSLAGGARCD